MKPSPFFVALVGALVFTAVSQAAIIETVPVGNPGNPADMRYTEFYHPNGVGAVAYSFRIGKTEVTNAQYAAFLNAVAATDTHGLYSTSMDSSVYGGIARSGSSGSFSYNVKAPALSGAYPYDDKPVVFVSSGDAMRFANWLHNDQPSGPQNASTTEDGTYTLNGAFTNAQLAAVTRNSAARWWLPNEGEWYKAAYHKNNGVTNNYWNYPTGTDSVPNNNHPQFDTGNSANFLDGNDNVTTGNVSFPMTDAGAYLQSSSPYGTFDQGGNVSEWNETLFEGRFRGFRGGDWGGGSHILHASAWYRGNPAAKDGLFGFRVATIPEPSALYLGTMAVISIVWRRKRRGKPLLPTLRPL